MSEVIEKMNNKNEQNKKQQMEYYFTIFGLIFCILGNYDSLLQHVSYEFSNTL